MGKYKAVKDYLMSLGVVQMFVLVKKENHNEWLCYDGLSETYWFRPAFHFQVSMWSNLNHKDFKRIPEDVRNQIKPMKLVLAEVEVSGKCS